MSRDKYIAIVYTKDPLKPAVGMDVIRWYSLSQALAKRGYVVDMVTIAGTTRKSVSQSVQVVPFRDAPWTQYQWVKGCYQSTVPFLPRHPHLFFRLARVVGKSSARDRLYLDEYCSYQNKIASMAQGILVNDSINKFRWEKIMGRHENVYIVPNACPMDIPAKGKNPYGDSFNPIAVFLGAVTSRRMVSLLNQIGCELAMRNWRLWVVGKNKTDYYCGKFFPLNLRFCSFKDSVTYGESWQYLYYAKVGLTIAPGPYVFENESSKIYYYLRAALPVVFEDRIPNGDVVRGVEWGDSFPYGDGKEAAQLLISWGKKKVKKTEREKVVQKVLLRHSWDERAGQLDRIFQKCLL